MDKRIRNDPRPALRPSRLSVFGPRHHTTEPARRLRAPRQRHRDPFAKESTTDDLDDLLTRIDAHEHADIPQSA